ncbi:MAG: hypothetical protein CM15mP62_17210 [Rhodospirillaceae bacterium]|nr:MAG: hypothetical protein CM15mP62_17210 [Rhodospirillaceae bacterium]
MFGLNLKDEREKMKKSYKDDNFGSRMANAAKAREAVLARIKAQPAQGIQLSRKGRRNGSSGGS